jgi:hypothetical protein
MSSNLPETSDAIRADNPRPSRSILAIAILIVLVLLIALCWLAYQAANADSTSEKISLRPASGGPAPIGRTIRVGVVISYYRPAGSTDTSSGISPNQGRIVDRELRHPSLEIVPIIDPGTEDVPQIASMLGEHFSGATPLNGYDPEALKTLDVIVANMASNCRPELLDAIEAAVSEGTGLVHRQSFASFTPGFTPQVLRLHGLTAGQYGYREYEELLSTVVAEHEILGTLSGPNHTLTVRANGPFGVLAPHSTALIRLNDINEVRSSPIPTDRGEYAFHPLYVSQLGKGRIVVCAFQGFKPAPEALDEANGGQFMVKAIQWAAKPETK